MNDDRSMPALFHLNARLGVHYGNLRAQKMLNSHLFNYRYHTLINITFFWLCVLFVCLRRIICSVHDFLAFSNGNRRNMASSIRGRNAHSQKSTRK